MSPAGFLYVQNISVCSPGELCLCSPDVLLFLQQRFHLFWSMKVLLESRPVGLSGVDVCCLPAGVPELCSAADRAPQSPASKPAANEQSAGRAAASKLPVKGWNPGPAGGGGTSGAAGRGEDELRTGAPGVHQ